MTRDTLFKRTLFFILILAWIWQCCVSCDEYDIDIVNNFNQQDTIQSDTVYIYPELRNYCAGVYFDVYIGNEGMISVNAYPDSMQYLMDFHWTFRGRLFNQSFERYDWDLVEVLPFRDEYWDVVLEVQFPGNEYSPGCAAFIQRVVNPYNGYISQRELEEL